MDTRQQQTVKGSDLLVAALENDGVDRIFGIPGEKTSTSSNPSANRRSSSSSPGMSRLRPSWRRPAAGSPASQASASQRSGRGALNFSTGAAYALLGAMPMIMIT